MCQFKTSNALPRDRWFLLLGQGGGWADSAIRLFDHAISPWREDFDNLYAPVSTSPVYAISSRSERWAALEPYWQNNFGGDFAAARLIRVLVDQGFFRLAQLFQGSLLKSLTPYPIGPSQVLRYYATSHAWVSNAYEVSELKDDRIRSILAEFSVPALPLSGLGVSSCLPQSMWVRDLKMGRHVLPVYSDLLYRLQHNALSSGHRLQHLYGAQSMCHHGCDFLEMAPHFFWYSLFLVHSNKTQFYFLSWSLKRRPTSAMAIVVFHIVRVVIFRCLWLHRNDIRFHDFQANVMNDQALVKAVVELHNERYYQNLVFGPLRHSGLKQRGLQELLASPHLSEALPLCPKAVDH
ncbi:hypothetical protein Plhal703r1_c08g0045051 [Plasmopara halstedii]